MIRDLFFNTETLGAALIGLIGIIAIVIYGLTRKIKPLEIKPVDLSSKEITNLDWILTSDERKDVNKKVIARLFFASIPIFFGFLFFRIIDLEMSSIKYFALLYIVIIILSFSISYIYMLFSKPKEIKYSLNNKSIIISKGNDSGEFNWSDFLYFYISPPEIQSANKGNEEKEENGYYNKLRTIRGETYYLKLKPTGIFSKMNIVERSLVIYTKPDNYQKVFAFLLTKLQQKIPENIGFQKYYFK